jgi:hypothetical protein
VNLPLTQPRYGNADQSPHPARQLHASRPIFMMREILPDSGSAPWFWHGFSPFGDAIRTVKAQ